MNEDRIMKQLERMVNTGRISEAEAERLRATQGTVEFAETLNAVRARHAGAHLDQAVADGRMSEDEANDYLDRIRAGDHSRQLRSEVSGSRAKT